jgi:hypothetical protein
MVGSSMIVEMLSAGNGCARRANTMANSQWTTDDFLRYGGEDPKAKTAR